MSEANHEPAGLINSIPNKNIKPNKQNIESSKTKKYFIISKVITFLG